MLTFVSEIMSASHFSPLCRVNAHRSDANQNETAVRPKQLKAEKTVVTVDVIRCWLEEYAKSTKPMEKHATERTRNTRGDRLIQIRTHQGVLWPGDRLKENR